MDEILFLTPLFKDKIWGGEQLQRTFPTFSLSKQVGEAWLVSGLDETNIIVGGKYDGMTLASVYQSKPALFKGAKGAVFPLLIKMIDAKQDLSIQVHPDNKYAKKNANGSLGKCECWYVLKSEQKEIILGHRAQNKKELTTLVKDNAFEQLLCQKKVTAGDFVMIKPGTIHALKAGVMVYEVQQASDITYRLYDYDRLENGQKRALHLADALSVIKTPYRYKENKPKVKNFHASALTILGKSPYFKVFHITCRDELVISNPNFLVMTVLKGEGEINKIPLTQGTSFIVTSLLKKVIVNGNMELMVTHL